MSRLRPLAPRPGAAQSGDPNAAATRAVRALRRPTVGAVEVIKNLEPQAKVFAEARTDIHAACVSGGDGHRAARRRRRFPAVGRTAQSTRHRPPTARRHPDRAVGRALPPRRTRQDEERRYDRAALLKSEWRLPASHELICCGSNGNSAAMPGCRQRNEAAGDRRPRIVPEPSADLAWITIVPLAAGALRCLLRSDDSAFPMSGADRPAR
jgi:hypothetical protein